MNMAARTIPASWRLVAPGIYVDERHAMHFFAGEFLRGHGMPDNEHNRRMAEEALKAEFPDVPVHEDA